MHLRKAERPEGSKQALLATVYPALVRLDTVPASWLLT
jgi:hypothetical protein